MGKSGEIFDREPVRRRIVQCWSIRFSPLPQRILSLLLCVFMSSICVAQTATTVPRFWGFKQGDRLLYTFAGSRRTEIVLDELPSVIQETSESFRVQFTAMDFERNGDVFFRVDVLQIDRKPEAGSQAPIKVPQVFLRVQPDGKVMTLNPEIREMLVATLADGNPETINILKTCLTDESIASWFNVPFWSRGPAENPEEPVDWERTHETSLGTLGTLQTDMMFKKGDIEKDAAKVAITGKARFRPLVLPDADRATFPFFSNVSVEIDEISGTAIQPQPPMSEDAPPEPRFGFESVDWTLKLHGEAKLFSPSPSKPDAAAQSDEGNSGAVKADATAGKVTFRQTQHHVWKLQSFESSNRRMFENDRFRVPVPVQ